MLLLYWLEYDVIRKPLNSLWGQGEHRKSRNLMLALYEKIDDFFAKDPDRESILRSYYFWTKLAGVSRIELRLNDSVTWQKGPEDRSHRLLVFKQQNWEVRITLPEHSWNIDSDVKSQLLEKVSFALMTRLDQLESPSVIKMKNIAKL